MWMNVEIWSTTIIFYIATLVLLKKQKKTLVPSTNFKPAMLELGDGTSKW